MDNWNNDIVHLRYHGVILMNDEIDPALPRLDTVGDNCVVYLKSESGTLQSYRIEDESPKAFGSEYLDAKSDLAGELLGKKVGETITLPKGLKDEVWRIEEIKHPALDALHRSMREFNRRFPRTKGLMQFDFDPNTEHPFEEMTAVMKASSERDERALDLYREKNFPFLFISSFIGRDPIEAWMGLLEFDKTLRVSFGNAEERTSAAELLKNFERKGCVVDPITLALVQRLGLKEAVEHVCGPICTTQSVLDVFAKREVELSGDLTDRGLSIGYKDGQLIRTVVSKSDLEAAYRVRQNEHEWVRTNCRIVPAIPAEDLHAEQQGVVEKVDSYASEPAIAAQGQGLLLLSDDMGFRIWASGTFGVKATWLLPVLKKALEEEAITESQYSLAINSMALAGHSYISLSAGDIYFQLKKNDFQVSKNVIRLIESTTGPNADIQSNMGVLGQLVGHAIRQSVDMNTVCRLTNAIFMAWSRGRTEHLRALVNASLKCVPDCPDWLRESALSWLIGHSMGMPYFDELVALQKSIRG